MSVLDELPLEPGAFYVTRAKTNLQATSDNVVKTQVWMAICVYVLVAIMRKELRLELSLSQILQVLSVNVFGQVSLVELVAQTASQNEIADSNNQLTFNNF